MLTRINEEDCNMIATIAEADTEQNTNINNSVRSHRRNVLLARALFLSALVGGSQVHGYTSIYLLALNLVHWYNLMYLLSLDLVGIVPWSTLPGRLLANHTHIVGLLLSIDASWSIQLPQLVTWPIMLAASRHFTLRITAALPLPSGKCFSTGVNAHTKNCTYTMANECIFNEFTTMVSAIQCNNSVRLCNNTFRTALVHTS